MSKQSSSRDSSIVNLFNTLMKNIGSSDEQDKEISLLDTSLSAAKEFFERQAFGGISFIGSNDRLDDFIAIKGEPTQLALPVGRSRSLIGARVHFLIDGKKFADALVGPELKARTSLTASESGYFPVSCILAGKKATGKKGGRKNILEISDSRYKKELALHVLDSKPVVCVDAGLLNSKKSNIDKQLVQLADKGFDVVYIDFGKKDRIEEICKIRERRSLPKGAIIPFTARIRQFESFDVDFKQSFLSLAVNRLRAQGAPVVALISDLELDHDHSFPAVDLFDENEEISEQQVNTMKRSAKNFLAKRKRFRGTQKHSAIEWRVNEMVSGKWSKENHCKVQLNNKLAREDIFKAIDRAERQVDLQFYIFRESRFVHELGVSLARAANRGVKVRLMVDALWSGESFFGSWNSFLKRMEKTKGIHIVGADAVTLADEWDALSLRQRDHRKLVIVDAAIAFVGGRNAADEYYYDWSEVPIADWTLAEHIPWLDAHVQLEGPGVKAVQKLFDRTWKRNGGKYLPTVRKKIAKADSADRKEKSSRVMLVVHEGTRDANGLAAYESLICGAEKKLILVNDFPVLDDIAEMLMQAVHRGVKVTFLTGNVLARRADGSFFEGGRHRELFEYVVKSRLGVLAEAGVEVYEFQSPELDNIAIKGKRVRPYVHAKLITADSRYASIGSANLDISASYWEREANIFIDDAKVVRSLDQKLEHMVREGVRLDTDSAEWKKESTQREIVARLWPDSFLS